MQMSGLNLFTQCIFLFWLRVRNTYVHLLLWIDESAFEQFHLN